MKRLSVVFTAFRRIHHVIQITQQRLIDGDFLFEVHRCECVTLLDDVTEPIPLVDRMPRFAACAATIDRGGVKSDGQHASKVVANDGFDVETIARAATTVSGQRRDSSESSSPSERGVACGRGFGFGIPLGGRGGQFRNRNVALQTGQERRTDAVGERDVPQRVDERTGDNVGLNSVSALRIGSGGQIAVKRVPRHDKTFRLLPERWRIVGHFLETVETAVGQ